MSFLALLLCYNFFRVVCAFYAVVVLMFTAGWAARLLCYTLVPRIGRLGQPPGGYVGLSIKSQICTEYHRGDLKES